MKKALVLTTGLVSLMAMSFTLPKQSKFEVVNTQTKEEFKFVLLKKEDWKELEKFSVYGATTSTLVHQTSRTNILNTTQYKSKDATLSEKQKIVLRKILKKYE